MLHGMVFKKEAEGDVTSVKDAKIAVFSCPFDCMVTETKVSSFLQCYQSSRHWSALVWANHVDGVIALKVPVRQLTVVSCLTGHSADKQCKGADGFQ